jgi:DNA processing protein
LPGINHRRLRHLVALGSPARTWQWAVEHGWAATGMSGEISAEWDRAARRSDPARSLDDHRRHDVGVVLHGEPDYPEALLEDHAAPAVLFFRGEPQPSGRPTVAMVGTRRSTGYGERVAHHLGAASAEAGISVVSGLALGIDAAAHAGCASVDGAPPVAVVACGLDVVYPRRNRELWRAVERQGVVWSEAPLGVAPERWRFPLRNRLIAALGEVLVVVESGRAGGSMHTVREADDRGRTVMAVPGPVVSSSSDGPNLLLSEGCPPCRDLDDLRCALGLSPSGTTKPAAEPRVELTLEAGAVLDAFEWSGATVDDLVARTGLGVPAVSVALSELLETGAIRPSGGLFEPIGR